MKTFKLEKSIKAIGIAQITLGLLTVAFGVVIITLLNQNYFINNNAVPIWSGVALICTGIFAELSITNVDENWLIKCYVGCNALSIFLLFLEACTSLAGIVYYEACPAQVRRNHYNYEPEPSFPPCLHAGVGRGMFSVTFALAVIASIVTVVGFLKSQKLSSCQGDKKDSKLSLLVKEDEVGDVQHDLEEGSQIVTLLNGKKYVLIPYSFVEVITTSQVNKDPPKYEYKDE
ncbi:uncharacterized protein LOC130614829 [Hydractinia symbiolongicarpus]|uniref:uncharacterized protein LOC130614829 n=1 Tax=Hydractinia symbiolongicarpus TaxID=13093 RepID=UPI00254CF4CF|nr:uncharacterized protein LOC130614829 [Hydractinia symbiolongicarpus]